MLTIYQGTFDASPEVTLWESIRADVDAGRECILIVPEQETLIAESRGADLLPPSAPLYFEVSNFTRLCDRAFRLLGGISENFSDTVAKSLLMWRALKECSDALVCPSYKTVGEGAVKRATAALSQMNALGLSPADLSEAAAALKKAPESAKKNAKLIAKLSDMSIIAAAFSRLHAEKYTDSAAMLRELYDKIEKNPTFLSGVKIYLSGFTSFTADQRKVLTALIGRTDVTAGLILPHGAENEFCYAEVKLAKTNLIHAARKCGVDPVIPKKEVESRIKSARVRALIPLLWDRSADVGEIPEGTKEDLRILCARTPHEEADFLCADILRKVREEGAKFADFAIVASSAESYAGILDTALRRSGIPYFYSIRRGIASFDAVKTILCAYDCVKTKFSREAVTEYAKCRASGVAHDDCDLFETYCECWKIEGGRFTDGKAWTMPPRGYAQTPGAGDAKMLERILDVRARIAEVLAPFEREVAEASTVREHAVALYHLICKLDLANAIRSEAERLAAMGENELAADSMKLYKILLSTLDRVVEVMGDFSSEGDVFCSLFKIALSSVDIGHLPSTVDQVTVGSANLIRLQDKRHVYLIGVNAGVFPGTPVRDVFLPVEERAVLKTVNPEVDADREIAPGRELYVFTRAFASASDSVTLTYCKKNASFGAVLPAAIVERIEHLTGGAVKSADIDSLPLHERIGSASSLFRRAGELTGSERAQARDALNRLGYAEKAQEADAPIENGGVALSEESTRPMRDSTLVLSASKIEKYHECPMAYYCSDLLKLKEEPQGTLTKSVIGEILHSVAENLYTYARDRKISLAEIPKEERDAFAQKYILDYLKKTPFSDVSGAVENHMVQKLIRAERVILDDLADESRDSRFTPTFFELSIRPDTKGTKSGALKGKGEAISAPVFREGEADADRGATLSGFIDRADFARIEGKLYARIIDYKTGNKTLSKADLENGKNLQMLLYMQAITECTAPAFLQKIGAEEGEKIIPAGVQYLNLATSGPDLKRPSDDAVENFRDNQTRRGLVLGEPDVIRAFGGDGYQPVRITKNGTVHGQDVSKTYTPEEWEQMLTTVKGQVLGTASRIRCGDMHAVPTDKSAIGSHCSYCPFSHVCRATAEAAPDAGTPGADEN